MRLLIVMCVLCWYSFAYWQFVSGLWVDEETTIRGWCVWGRSSWVLVRIRMCGRVEASSWRNGSASDSRSEGCVFESRRAQRFCTHTKIIAKICFIWLTMPTLTLLHKPTSCTETPVERSCAIRPTIHMERWSHDLYIYIYILIYKYIYVYINIYIYIYIHTYI